MNSLSRRVSNMKANEKKKSTNLPSEPLALPTAYQKFDVEKDFVKEFRLTETVSDQLNFVKQRLCADEIGSDEVKFFADLMLRSPLKHPARSQIKKLLQQPKLSELLADVLPTSIAMLIKELKTSSITESNAILASLATCFENFPSGVKALEKNIPELFFDLNIVIVKLIMEINCNHSPSVKNEFCSFLHNAIRLSLSCIQEYSKTQSFKSLHNDLRTLKENCMKIINTNDIPMDIKTNCGMLLAHLARIFDEHKDYIKCCLNVAAGEDKFLQLCLCMGFISTIEFEFFMKNSQIVGDIIGRIIEIATANSNENTILLAALRSLVQFSKFLLLMLKSNVSIDQEMLKIILRKLIDFDLSFIGSNMDNVRHLCKDMLRNIFKFKDKLMLDDLVCEIFDYCNSKDIPAAFRSVVITCAGSVLGTNFVLQKLPRLFEDIFIDLGKDPNIYNCYETLMLCHLKEKTSNIKMWHDIWIDPILSLAIRFPDKIEVVENLLNKAVSNDPKIADLIISNKTHNIPLCVKFSTMWTVRKHGLKYDKFEKVFQAMKNDLMSATTLNSDEVKIMALRLIVETNKTTTFATQMECDFIIKFLRYNSNCQSPATREKAQALILKFLYRLELNLLRCKKEKNQELFETYKTFLLNLLHCLSSNFFIGANFSRRSMSLNLLEKAVEIAITNDIPEIIPKYLRKCLFELLNDSYESNAALAIKILRTLSQQGTTEFDIHISLETIYDLITSVRPADCVTAAYYLEYFCLGLTVHDIHNQLQIEEVSPQHQVFYCIIIWLLRVLESSLETAKKSITLAAKLSPLYGPLFAIRHFLGKLDFVDLSNCSKWRKIAETLITNCKRMTQVVGPVVNSSSPEGHLPNDFSDLSNYVDDYVNEEVAKFEKCLALKKKLSLNEKKDLKVTPQMILLCSWRTIKEISLTLGELVLRSPIQEFKDDKEYLLTGQQILDIGDHFIELLSETKHRGAFEQAYVGFSKLCTRLWRIPHKELNVLPSKWLLELIDLISTDVQINKKICATRRSAGVPFMVQAICIAELQVGTTTSLHSCMTQFINICSDPKKSEESRTHALNIMRALFRCTELNSVVGEYIADALKCAINGHAAKSWCENNSATMLLSALIVRIFGVQRSRGTNNVSKENKMTGRIFFLRYPSLYDFMLTELKNIVHSISLNLERSAKLRPILMVLSRLYPSALDGTETMYKLSTFIPLLSGCYGCQEWQHRVLIAKTMVAFTPSTEIDALIVDCLARTEKAIQPNTFVDNTNYLQSLILQALYLLQAKEIDYKLAEAIISQICSILVRFQLNSIVCSPIISILNAVMEKCPNIDKYSDIIKVELSLVPKLNNTNYTILRRNMFIYDMHLLKGFKSITNTAIYVKNILRPTNEQNLDQDVVESCLNVLLMVFRDKLSLKEIIDQFECSANEVSLVESYSSDMKNGIITELARTEEFKNMLMTLTQGDYLYPHCTIRAYSLLAKLNDTKIGDHNFISKIIDKVDEYTTGELKNAITQCIGKVLRDGTGDQTNFSQILDFLLDVSQPWNCCALRRSATYVLHEVARILFSSQENLVSPQILLVFTKIVLLMVQDEESGVRESIAMTITNLFSTSPTLKTLVESYAQIVFLEKLADYLQQHFNDDEKLLIIRNIIGFLEIENKTNQKTDTNDEVDVFDRQEVNAFGEPYKIILDLKDVFNEKFLNCSALTNLLKSLND